MFRNSEILPLKYYIIQPWFKRLYYTTLMKKKKKKLLYTDTLFFFIIFSINDITIFLDFQLFIVFVLWWLWLNGKVISRRLSFLWVHFLVCVVRIISPKWQFIKLQLILNTLWKASPKWLKLEFILLGNAFWISIRTETLTSFLIIFILSSILTHQSPQHSLLQGNPSFHFIHRFDCVSVDNVGFGLE